MNIVSTKIALALIQDGRRVVEPKDLLARKFARRARSYRGTLDVATSGSTLAFSFVKDEVWVEVPYPHVVSYQGGEIVCDDRFLNLQSLLDPIIAELFGVVEWSLSRVLCRKVYWVAPFDSTAEAVGALDYMLISCDNRYGIAYERIDEFGFPICVIPSPNEIRICRYDHQLQRLAFSGACSINADLMDHASRLLYLEFDVPVDSLPEVSFPTDCTRFLDAYSLIDAMEAIRDELHHVDMFDNMEPTCDQKLALDQWLSEDPTQFRFEEYDSATTSSVLANLGIDLRRPRDFVIGREDSSRPFAYQRLMSAMQ